MKLLLDTHIWIWSVLEPARLSVRVARELSDPANQLWLSPVSVWELFLLSRKGRLHLEPDALSWTTANLSRLKLHEAPLTFDVALAISSLNLPHNDPADGFLAATAKVFALTLVTADEELAQLTEIQVLRNR
ncbi:MAG TPA: type II toxin-antitoxin system VapC family toxin [Candidatus Sulfotelmatobacter sp.]